MFSGLRQSSTFYVLHKGNERPTLKVGQVQGVTSPRPRYSSSYPTPASQMFNDQVVDVSVRYSDGKSESFQQLPATASIANFGNDGVVVAESREAMLNEVENMKRTSQDILNSTDYHKSVVEAADDMLAQLNPQVAKDRQTEERIGAMEQRMGGVETALSSIKDMLTSALNRPSSNSPKNNR